MYSRLELECESMYTYFLENGDYEIAEELLCCLGTARREKWSRATAELDCKHSNRKTCKLLRKLGATNLTKRNA